MIKKTLIAVAGVVLAFGGISAAHALGHTTTPARPDLAPATAHTDITSLNPATTVADDQGDQNDQGDNNDQGDQGDRGN
jgi:hypothetical protein